MKDANYTNDTMDKEVPTVTRREVLQGISGITAVTMLHGNALASQHAKTGASAAWTGNLAVKFAPLSFSDSWRFHRGDAPGAEAVSFADSEWRVLNVPHDWSIEDLPGAELQGKSSIWTNGNGSLKTGPFDLYASEGQGATGWTVGGVGWYRKSFDKPDVPQDGKVELRFEGVYMICDVWINGVHLGTHPYGYTPFAFDVTPHLQRGKNVVAVKVNNTGQNSRWYSGSGIYRKVWLSVAGDLRIPENGVFVTTPEVNKEAAIVNVIVTTENGAATIRKATVRVRLLDVSGSTAGEARASLSVAANSTAMTTCVVKVPNPNLWSSAKPNLYRAEVMIESGGNVADATALKIGVRKVEIDAVSGLRINGEALKLQGGCVHHDNGVLGSACITRAEERRVELLKASGFNAIRTSHNPPSRDFLDACDRIGMIVIDEAFDCWEIAKKDHDYHLYFNEWWQRDLEAMVLRDRNHPSVLFWSIGNEIQERYRPRGLEIGKAMQTLAHKLDPTRPVTAAICGAWDLPGSPWKDTEVAFDYLDVGGYNYRSREYEPDHANYPQRVMIGTESFPKEVFENWELVEKNNFLIGDFVWTAMDYIGESGVGHSSIVSENSHDTYSPPYPWFNAFCGDIDLIGNKKPQSYFRDIVWRRSPVEMAVQRPVPNGWKEHISGWGWSDELRSWTWPGMDEKPLTVRVYTRGDKVTLLLNGEEVGSKALTEKDALRAEFTVPYVPGQLKAVAYQNGKEIGTITFTTAGKAHQLVLRPDRTTLNATRDDLSYVMVQVVDEVGRLVPDAVVPVSFALSGAGEIAAVGNANPKDVASFRQPKHDTFHGECLVVVRPTGKAGAIELKAEAPGLESATTILEVAGD